MSYRYSTHLSPKMDLTDTTGTVSPLFKRLSLSDGEYKIKVISQLYDRLIELNLKFVSHK